MSHSHTRGAGADRSRALASTFSRQLNKETSHTAMDDGARRISTIFYHTRMYSHRWDRGGLTAASRHQSKVNLLSRT